MKKQTNLHSIKLLSLAIVAAITIAIGTTFPASTQQQPTYKVGDRFEVNHFATVWVKGTVVRTVERADGVRAHDDDDLTIMAEANKLRPLKEVEKDNTAKDDKKQTTDADKKVDAKQESSGYKVGDRVEVDPLGIGQRLRCTITRKIQTNVYAVRCDPQGKVTFMDYNVLENKIIRPLKDAAPAPTFECSFEKPTGTVTRTSPATAATFKRVIYDSEAMTEKRRVGVQFQDFQFGKAFKNILTTGGLMHDVAARNTMVYPIRTQYKICVEGSAEYNYMAIVKQDFKCFKNSFGDWVCSVASPRTLTDRQDVPKDQK